MEPITIKLKEVAKLIGVSRQTIYRVAKSDKNFPRPRKVCKSYLFVRSEIEAYLKDKFAYVGKEKENG